ncbi:MazG-like family protein [Streptomyces tropicalis]|uniref:MazG-like family protein n=1 Tax=Streptomyces tropicalis TaxID=3034234 RepID=A0ABT5ZY00_9ACTN|nr:MazG-like family protein [Streptomyces tropicalis]MDF3297270.1 MazG-like family protein [Streptomyces tropicalis]
MAADQDAPLPAHMDDLWDSIDGLWAWLDGNTRRDDGAELLLRLLKLSEEVGEVAQAVIGAMGHNPRKGASHTWEDVQAELCNVAITALVALRTLTPDARAVFTHHLNRVTARSLNAVTPRPPHQGGEVTPQ